MAMAEPTPYALVKIRQVTRAMQMVASTGLFSPTLAVRYEMEAAMPVSTSTRPNHAPQMIWMMVEP